MYRNISVTINFEALNRLEKFKEKGFRNNRSIALEHLILRTLDENGDLKESSVLTKQGV